MSQVMYSHIDTWNKRWCAVVTVVENVSFTENFVSDVDGLFCFHKLDSNKVILMGEKLRI